MILLGTKLLLAAAFAIALLWFYGRRKDSAVLMMGLVVVATVIVDAFVQLDSRVLFLAMAVGIVIAARAKR